MINSLFKKNKSNSKKIIRKPAVAGSFYPEEKEEIDIQLTNFLKNTQLVKITGRPRILIVPHAGFIYSGQVAAWGFKQIEKQNFKRIILLGASHTAWFDHVALDTQNFWETPLGKTKVDLEFVEKIIDKNKKIIGDPLPFLKEHSLEMELIFLQKILKNFTIVPILVSEISEKLINNLAEKLSKNFDENTLLVVSTDLSHYPPYKIAKIVDEKTINAILSGKKEIFDNTIKEIETSDYTGLQTAACGQKAVSVALKVAEILNIRNFQKIYYANSGDVSGDYSHVVGYASIVASSPKLSSFFSNSNKDKIYYLDEDSQKEALKIARITLEEYLTHGTIPTFTPKNPSLLKPLGCFITLRNRGQLRGCIGEFEPNEPLYKVIQKTAVNAAVRDFRFPPVDVFELKDIKIEISVMTPKRKILDWREIKLGKHGVIIQKGINAGTFLPQVATETGWSLEEFLSHLCTEKAGLPSNCYKDPSVSIYVFEVQVFKED